MSDSQDVKNLSLDERLKKANYLSRELSEHLRQSYLPKLARLRSNSKVYDPVEISDQRILDEALAILEAESFTDDIYTKLRCLLESIVAEMREMVYGATSGLPSAQQRPTPNTD